MTVSFLLLFYIDLYFHDWVCLGSLCAHLLRMSGCLFIALVQGVLSSFADFFINAKITSHCFYEFVVWMVEVVTEFTCNVLGTLTHWLHAFSEFFVDYGCFILNCVPFSFGFLINIVLIEILFLLFYDISNFICGFNNYFTDSSNESSDLFWYCRDGTFIFNLFGLELRISLKDTFV